MGCAGEGWVESGGSCNPHHILLNGGEGPAKWDSFSLWMSFRSLGGVGGGSAGAELLPPCNARKGKDGIPLGAAIASPPPAAMATLQVGGMEKRRLGSWCSLITLLRWADIAVTIAGRQMGVGGSRLVSKWAGQQQSVATTGITLPLWVSCSSLACIMFTW